jgi:hypothetical protein
MIPFDPNLLYLIVELFAAATVLIRLSGDLATTLGTTLKKFQRLKKIVSQ